MRMVRLVVACGLVLGGVVPAAANTCISAYRIDHTERPDDTAVIFYMRGGDVWRAPVTGGRCIGLANDTRGFTYEANPGTDELCSNLWTLRLNTTGGICLMGTFEKLPIKAK